MRGGFELFRPFGVTVRLHPGFLVFLGVLALLAMAAGGTPAEVFGRLVAPALLVVTVLLHEMGHALVARRVGLEVIDVVLTPLGGMARLHGLMEDADKEIAVAASGPGANLITAGIIAPIAWFVVPRDELSFEHLSLLSERSMLDSHPLTMALSFNLLLGLLNLIPAFPMDGGRILRGLLTRKIGLLLATRFAFRVGMWFAVILFLAPFFLRFRFIAWWVLPIIGAFLLFSGGRERLLVEAREGLGRMQGRIFTAGFGNAPAGGPFAPQAEEGGADDDIIDVSGQARIVGDEDPSLPS